MMGRKRTDQDQRRDKEFGKESDQIDVRTLHAPILRELDEPRDGYEPVPIWLVFIFFALLGWGGWYLGAYSGNWNSMVYDERPAVRGPGGAGEEEGERDAMAMGRRVYNNCVACHRMDGSGGGSYPPLNGSEWVAGRPDRLAAILIHGLHGPIEVKGETYNELMPAWGRNLTNGQIADVLTYVRGSWGNDTPAVSEEVVEAVREQTRGRSAPWTAEELEAFSIDMEAVRSDDEPTT